MSCLHAGCAGGHFLIDRLMELLVKFFCRWWNFKEASLKGTSKWWILSNRALMDVDLMNVGPLFAVREQWSCNKLLNTFSSNKITFCLFLPLSSSASFLGWLWQLWAAVTFTRFERAASQSSDYSLTLSRRGVAVHTEMAHADMHIMTKGNTKPWWWKVVFAVWK